MLHKTSGIIFKSTEYGEASLVVQIYTELFGIQSYLINGVRKKNARIHANVFQPLTLVDLVVYHKERPGLQRISDIRPSPPLINIPFDVYKSSVIFFLNEILCKTIHEEESNPSLFNFIHDSILWIDRPEPVEIDYHLVFMFRLCSFLGFAPTNNYSADFNIFNLKEGRFQSAIPNHPHFINYPLSERFSRLTSIGNNYSLEITTSERRLMINFLLEYFTLHVEGFGNIKSQKILEEVWDN